MLRTLGGGLRILMDGTVIGIFFGGMVSASFSK